MAAFTSKASGNWTASGQTTWNEVGVPGAGDTVSIATGHAITLDQTSPEAVTCTSITIAGTGTLVIPDSTTFTINADIINNGTATTGAIVVGTGQAVVVNGQVTNASTGAAIKSGGSGTVTITNSGSTAILNSSSGDAVHMLGTGAVTVTGAISQTGTEACLFVQSVSTAHAVTGAVSNTGATNRGAIFTTAGTVTIAGDVSATANYGIGTTNGTIVLDGNCLSSGGAAVLRIIGSGTIQWTGNHTLAAEADCYVLIQGGTLRLAVASTSHLALANSGNVVIHVVGGSIVSTATGHVATITKQTATATQAVLGGGAIAATFLVDPTLPAAADVETGVEYGYAGDPQTGTFAGGGTVIVVDD